MAICKACGASSEGNFCSNCGAKLEESVQAFCTACGAPLVPDARFCGRCGYAVDAIPVEPAMVAAAPVEPIELEEASSVAPFDFDAISDRKKAKFFNEVFNIAGGEDESVIDDFGLESEEEIFSDEIYATFGYTEEIAERSLQITSDTKKDLVESKKQSAVWLGKLKSFWDANKRIVMPACAVVLVLIPVIALAFGRSSAVKEAEALIASIGEVTLNSKNQIINAEKAVAALSESEKSKLENEHILLNARDAYDILVEVRDIEAAIKEIGDVTLGSKTAIRNAREKYDDATNEAKNKVTNLAVLVAAEEALSPLMIDDVVRRISEIGTVTLEKDDQIAAARRAYDDLSANEAGQVENAATLEAAEERLEVLEEEERKRIEAEKERERQAVLSRLRKEEDKVEGITWYESNSQPYYENYGCYALPYIGEKGSSVWLRFRMNYTGDNWVFFEKVIFVVDGEKTTKYYDYYDVNRDNGYGDVWENVDISPSSSDIELLKKIANSTETTIRFQGDDYHYDFTVPSSQKQGIKDVLAAYDILD